jgi:class III poly(R)-hydroxyalkanoic acid synthase PhaE subunit
MSDSADGNGKWAEQWIAQQRELLEKLAAAGGPSAAPAGQGSTDRADGWNSQWSEAQTAWLGGLLQTLSGAGTTGTTGAFPPAGETLEALRTAWSNSLAQAAAPGGWVDLLNRSPPLGLFREQTEAWRAVAAAQADCQRLEQELAGVMRRVQTDALNLLERRVQERSERGDAVHGFRELYNLWVECSEEVFSGVAHSSAYAHLQSEVGNATVRLRARIQKVIEQGLQRFDLPTRSEVNSMHLQLRQLRQQISALQVAATRDGAEPLAPATARQPVTKRKVKVGKPSTNDRARAGVSRRKQSPRRSRASS